MKKIVKRTALFMLASMLGILQLTGCGGSGKTDYVPVKGLDTSKKVTLRLAIPYETNKALNTISTAFMEQYPNVNIHMQYIEDYDANAVQLFKENEMDMIFQKDLFFEEYMEEGEDAEEKIPTGKTTDDYFYNFAADEEIDFSDTTPDISDNYLHKRTDEEGNAIVYQYSYPLGGETRGVFVNKTMLDEYGLSVPENYEEFLTCCETLKQNGFIPIQGGADTASYGLGIAPATNAVSHDETALAKMRDASPGISREFADTLEKLYNLSKNRYFDYKAVEKTGFYTSTDEFSQVSSFLGLSTDEETYETVKPENNYGYVAFMPYISSTGAVIESMIEEYGLDTEVEFICSPLNEKGTNSPVYITPYYGICANKNSENLDWIREYVNFLLQEENNRIYAEEASIIPNTTDALTYVAEKYGADVEKDVTMCGQIRFSDTYNGFNPLSEGLKAAIKCSAQKYMIDLNRDKDGNIQYETDEEGKEFLYMGNGETRVYKEYMGEEDEAMPGFAFCTLDYYLDNLENEFSNYRVG